MCQQRIGMVVVVPPKKLTSGYVVHFRARKHAKRPDCGLRFGKSSQMTSEPAAVTCSGCLELVPHQKRGARAEALEVVKQAEFKRKPVVANGYDYDKEAMALVWRWMEKSARHRPPLMQFDMATDLVQHISEGLKEILHRGK
jgi:hypothetical protein